MDVLVVDDHELIRQLVEMTLAPIGHSLRFAASAAAAMDELRVRAPDVAILDVMMPGEMNGLELCQYIKTTPPCVRTRVVLLTARSQAFDLQAGYDAGADRYVTKPFSPLELASILESLQETIR